MVGTGLEQCAFEVRPGLGRRGGRALRADERALALGAAVDVQLDRAQVRVHLGGRATKGRGSALPSAGRNPGHGTRLQLKEYPGTPGLAQDNSQPDSAVSAVSPSCALTCTVILWPPPTPFDRQRTPLAVSLERNPCAVAAQRWFGALLHL